MKLPDIISEPIGRCIYCGATEQLTREHVIPKGLKGIYILGEASCRNCAIITGRIENACLRHMMGRFRRRVGFKSTKRQPTTLPLRITKPDGSAEERLVPISELPTAISLPVWYHPPLMLLGEARPFEVATWTWIKNDAAAALAKLGGVGFEIAELHPLTFTRMLAKIAHAHAVMKFGYGKFKPLLIEHILSGLENPNPLIGGPPEQPQAESLLHRLTCNHLSAYGTNYILTEVRLLAQLGAPTYWVLTGEVE
jgi:hypothetical protein